MTECSCLQQPIRHYIYVPLYHLDSYFTRLFGQHLLLKKSLMITEPFTDVADGICFPFFSSPPFFSFYSPENLVTAVLSRARGQSSHIQQGFVIEGIHASNGWLYYKMGFSYLCVLAQN